MRDVLQLLVCVRGIKYRHNHQRVLFMQIKKKKKKFKGRGDRVAKGVVSWNGRQASPLCWDVSDRRDAPYWQSPPSQQTSSMHVSNQLLRGYL